MARYLLPLKSAFASAINKLKSKLEDVKYLIYKNEGTL